jgi:hypothetical protein
VENQNFDSKLDRILELLEKIYKREGIIMGDLDAITAQVAQNESVEQSAITLINSLASQIAGLINDPVALAALVTSMNASATALAAAITANTPAAPPASIKK